MSATLWAQLVELEQTTNTNQIAKARLVRAICESEQLSLREFAKQAREKYGLDGLGAHSLVSRLLAWAELLELAWERGVVPAGTTPAEWTLRPLFAKRVPSHRRLELLAKAVTDGTVTAKAIRDAVREAFPPEPRPRIPPPSEAKRLTMPPLRALIRQYGFDAVAAGWIRLVAQHERQELRTKQRAADGDAA